MPGTSPFCKGPGPEISPETGAEGPGPGPLRGARVGPGPVRAGSTVGSGRGMTGSGAGAVPCPWPAVPALTISRRGAMLSP